MSILTININEYNRLHRTTLNHVCATPNRLSRSVRYSQGIAYLSVFLIDLGPSLSQYEARASKMDSEGGFAAARSSQKGSVSLKRILHFSISSP